MSAERHELERAAAFLERLADTLEAWANESRHGGWSTHQVDANRRKAEECRLEAGRYRAALAKATGAA